MGLRSKHRRKYYRRQLLDVDKLIEYAQLSSEEQCMKAVDLFSGCGGLSLGFQNAGFEIVAAFDNWDPAIKIYKENFDHPVIKQDLANVKQTVKLIDQLKPEIIIGGPPCQDFSHAGKRSEGKRAKLTACFAEVIRTVKPRWFLMENVARAFTSTAFEDAKKTFKKAGYGLTIAILDASRCGVPQKRKRLVCLGKLDESDDFLIDHIQLHFSPKPMTVREYFGKELKTEHYYRHPRNYSRRAIYSIDEPAATIRGVNRPIPSGYKRHPGDAADPEDTRPLTTAERARIQTFPAKFRWLGTKTDKEQMIGNAVPVKLAEFVALCICEYERGEVCPTSSIQLPLNLQEGAEEFEYGEVLGVAKTICRLGEPLCQGCR